MRHLMIDLETLDTLPSAKVLSIGAVPFDPKRGEVAEAQGKHWVLDRDLQEGRTTSQDTVEWWERQSPEARASWDLPKDQLMDPKQVLRELWQFARQFSHPWSHGAGFDVVMLEDMFRWAGGHAPWQFWQVRDTRTIYDLAGVRVGGNRTGTHHNALDDAISQARAVCEAYKKLGLSY